MDRVCRGIRKLLVGECRKLYLSNIAVNIHQITILNPKKYICTARYLKIVQLCTRLHFSPQTYTSGQESASHLHRLFEITLLSHTVNSPQRTLRVCAETTQTETQNAHTDTQSHTTTHTRTDLHYIHTHTQTQRHTHTERHTHTQTYTHTHTHRHTHRHMHTQAHTDTYT